MMSRQFPIARLKLDFDSLKRPLAQSKLDRRPLFGDCFRGEAAWKRLQAVAMPERLIASEMLV